MTLLNSPTIDHPPKKLNSSASPKSLQVAAADSKLENISFATATVSEQLNFLEDALKAPLLPDQSMCLISSSWVQQFKKYAFSSDSHPGPIDNSALFENVAAESLKPQLMENLDFFYIPLSAWNKLVSWFPALQPAIKRQVILDSSHIPRPIVELYPYCFTVFSYQNQNDLHSIELSRKTTLLNLKISVCKLVGAIDNISSIRLWNGPSHAATDEFVILEDLNKRIDQIPIMPFIMVEERVDNQWPNDESKEFGKKKAIILPPPPPPPYSELQHTTPGSWPTVRHSFSPDKLQKTNGVTGLNNLGNTCFMNSALQCLSNTKPLTQYFLGIFIAAVCPTILMFLDGIHKREINVNNPLGMNGEVSEAYGVLVNRMWRNHESSVSPRDFKFTIGRFAPQFMGYQQHDSQELTAFLLDGLHEDLNRIVKKPYVEVPDYDGQISDEDFAKKLWSLHKYRNDSVIVDNFQGQYKSTLICPECKKVSITFDPYMYLSLPLPIQKKSKLSYTFIPNETSGQHPIRETIVVPGDTTMAKMRDILGKKYNVDPKKLIIIEEFSHKIYKRYCADEAVRDINRNDHVLVYQCLVEEEMQKEKYANSWNFSTSLSSSLQDSTVHPINVALIFGVERAGSYMSGSEEFGFPLFLTVPSKIEISQLEELVLEQCQRFTKLNISEFTVSNDNYVDTALENFGAQIDGKLNGEFEKSRLFTLKIKSSESRDHYEDIKLAEDGSFTLEKSHILMVHFKRSVYDAIFGAENSLFESVEDVTVENGEPPKEVDLHACFQEFSKSEQLGVDDAWYCPQCKKHQQASKKLDIWNVPDILVIHLKRFSHNRYHRDKLENFIDYPIKGLDLSEFITGPQHDHSESLIYDLYAVSNHMGGLGGGHYTAYAKNPIDESWYDFDDSRVTPIQETSVKTHMAYMLFYQRRYASSITGSFRISHFEPEHQEYEKKESPNVDASIDPLVTAPSSPVAEIDISRDHIDGDVSDADSTIAIADEEQKEQMDFEYS